MFIEQWDYTAVRTNLAAIKIHMRKITVNRMNLIEFGEDVAVYFMVLVINIGELSQRYH